MTAPTKEDLLALYEARGEEADFLAALPLFEEVVANGPSPEDLRHYGYLLECHGRNELRKAVAQYERAVEMDPGQDKVRYQLMSARAGLREAEREIEIYEKRLAAAPSDVREHRLLANAYLAGLAYEKAFEVAEQGLALAPDDGMLTYCRGEARAGLGDLEGALADWRRALSLDPEDIGALYMTAFLLERNGRIAEASDAWRSIIDWSLARGNTLDTEWPQRELERLTSLGAQA